MTTAGWLDSVLQDCRYALRSFGRHPSFVAVALLSLTLGIGATSSIFSVIHGVLIEPYPYAKPGEIWAIGLRGQDGRAGRGIYPIEDYLELTKLPAFADVMATSWETVLLTGEYLGIGLIGSWFATRLLESQLFGATAHDPLSFVAVGLVLGIVALAACYVPARRAGSVDPLIALRHE